MQYSAHCIYFTIAHNNHSMLADSDLQHYSSNDLYPHPFNSCDNRIKFYYKLSHASKFKNRESFLMFRLETHINMCECAGIN